MKYILWDPKDGRPYRDDGTLISGGALGILDEGNVYLRAYAKPLEGSFQGLSVGQSIPAEFRLSGERAVYDVYRVE